MSISAGRLVVESKMLEKLNTEKKKNFAKVNKFFQDSDRIESLPEEEKSTMWRPALMLYSISTPLLWISLLLFYVTPMQSDILCVLAKLGSSDKENFTVSYCTGNFTNDVAYTAPLKKDASWRWGMY